MLGTTTLQREVSRTIQKSHTLSLSLFIYIRRFLLAQKQIVLLIKSNEPHIRFKTRCWIFPFISRAAENLLENLWRKEGGSWDVAVVLCSGLLVCASDSIYPTYEKPQSLCRDHGRYSEGDQHAYWQALSPSAAGLSKDPGLHAL